MKIDEKLFEVLRDFHWQAMLEWGPDRHCDGSEAILYGILKLLGYDIPYLDEYAPQNEVDELIEVCKKELKTT